MTPSLGEIQAFLSAADHLDYKRVAEDLEITPTGARQRVQALEVWLHKLLILDDPTEISAGDGDAFIPIAWEILKRFEDACPTYHGLSVGAFGTSRIKMMAKIHLHDFERFLTVAAEGTYKGAAANLDCEVTTVQRSVKALEELTEKTLFSGHAALILTSDGEVFRETAAFIVKSLNDFRGSIPENHEIYREYPRKQSIFHPDVLDQSLLQEKTLLEEMQTIYHLSKKRETDLQEMAARIASTGKKQLGKVRKSDVDAALAVITKTVSAIEQGLIYIQNASQKNPDLDGVGSADTLLPLSVETECALQPLLPDLPTLPTQAPQIEDEWFDQWQAPPQNKA